MGYDYVKRKAYEATRAQVLLSRAQADLAAAREELAIERRALELAISGELMRESIRKRARAELAKAQGPAGVG